jgi:Zn-finger domain-containing protein
MWSKKLKQLITSTEEWLEQAKQYVQESYDSLDETYDFNGMFKTLSKQLNKLKKDEISLN